MVLAAPSRSGSAPRYFDRTLFPATRNVLSGRCPSVLRMSDNAFYGSAAWRQQSAAVTAGGQCARCGRRTHLIAHHLIPRTYGGADTRENLSPLCRWCHPTVEAQTKTLLDLAGLYRGETPAPSPAPAYGSLLGALAAPPSSGRYVGSSPRGHALMAAYGVNRGPRR